MKTSQVFRLVRARLQTSDGVRYFICYQLDDCHKEGLITQEEFDAALCFVKAKLDGAFTLERALKVIHLSHGKSVGHPLEQDIPRRLRWLKHWIRELERAGK